MTLQQENEAASAAPETTPGRPRPSLTRLLPRRRPRQRRSERPPLSGGAAVYGAALSIVAAMLLGFAADVTFVGALHHNRDQRIAYAALRLELAKGEAPVGPLDYQGKPLPLGAPVAILRVPPIGLTEVVLEGTTSGVLERGVGHARSTLLPGQVGVSVLMGRQAAYGGPFRHLDSLHVGDRFTVTTGQGESTYQVLDLRHAGDPVPAAPEAGHGRLQLVTATGPVFRPTGVLRVDADLVGDAKPAPTVGANLAPLTEAESPLRGDSSVLLVLVLWCQALLLAAAAVTWACMRWGRWQAWTCGVPLLAALGLAAADRVAQLLPNLM